MSKTNKTWLVGNWKLNGNLELLENFAQVLSSQFGRTSQLSGLTLGLGVPDLLVYPAAGILSGLPIQIGLQSCSAYSTGAYTGETSPQLGFDLGARFVILGHSERRIGQGETSEMVRAKAEKAQACGLLPIICVGETSEEKEAGQAESSVLDQVRKSSPAQGSYLIGYEPVWAIGTGKVAGSEDAQAMHAAIRRILSDASTPIIYGGSMNSDNAGDFVAQPDIDGGLIGGASLTPEDFLAICQSCS